MIFLKVFLHLWFGLRYFQPKCRLAAAGRASVESLSVNLDLLAVAEEEVGIKDRRRNGREEEERGRGEKKGKGEKGSCASIH